VREPEETREKRVSSNRRDDRRGGRGGRDRDRDRGRDKGGDKEKGGDKDREVAAGPRRRDEGRRDEPRREEGRRGSQPPRAEGVREDRPARGEGRGEARGEGRGEARGEGRGEARGEGRGEARGEGRGEARGEGREGRGGEGREGRRDGRRDERREERRPAAAEVSAAAPASAGAPPDAGQDGGADAQERRRRRRGRRGGRGRRREGMPPEAGAESGNGVTRQDDTLQANEAFEPHEAFDSRQEFETGEAPVETRSEPRYESRTEAAPRRAEAPVAVDTMEEPAMASSELAEQSRQLTEDMLRAMGFEATVTVTAEGNRADVTAEIAKDEDLLTGQKGEVRQALQHLLNRFLNRGEGSRYHLQLEINDFWARREQELEAMARSMAEQAVSGNTEVVTDYLNSQERRIVHVTLKEDARVKTFALGTGMIKRVAIAPASFPERTGEEDAG
jgi:predicted RNA-binding protein Jag